MSKSIRNKHDKNGVMLKIGGDSNKKDKRIANRKFRRHEKMEEKETLREQENMFQTTDIKDVSNIWAFSSDGRAIYINLNKTRWLGSIPKNERYKFKNK